MTTTTHINRTAAGTRIQRAAAVLGAAAVNLAVWAVTVPLAGVELIAHVNGRAERIGPAAIVVASVLAGLAGWGLLAVLERVVRRPIRTWTAIAVTVLALSLVAPLTNAADPTTTIVLLALHITVGAVLIPALPRDRSRGRRVRQPNDK